MRSPGLTVLMSVALTLAGCGCAIKGGVSAKGEVGPPTANIMQVSGRFSVGSACPIAPKVALTAAHVVDAAPLMKDVPLFQVVWQQGQKSGTADPRGVYRQRDLSILDLDAEVEFYPIAVEVPKVGERVWVSGWDFRDKSRAFKPRVWESRVTHSVAGLLIIEPHTEPGSSGSCILDSQGRIVAILVWKWPTGEGMHQDFVGVGVLVVGEEF